MSIHRDIAEALQRAAKRRHRDTTLRKEAQKNALVAEDYHTLQRQLNSTHFIQPLDAATTKSNIYYIKKRFIRFCHANEHGDWRKALQPQHCDKGFIMTFLHWICETYLQPRRKRSKKKSVNQYWRDFKMLYRRCNDGKIVNPNHCEEIRKYINDKLKTKFNLDDEPGSKPVLSVDDLLLGLTHHWSRDRRVFPTEDDRLDVAAIMLFQAYTACRPAELVDGTKRRGTGDPLLDDSGVDDAPSSKAAENCAVRGGRRQQRKLASATGRMSRPRNSIRRSGPASESDSDSDDFTLDSGDESDDGEIHTHQDDTSDTEYSDDGDEDIDMLQTEPRPDQLAGNAKQDEDQEAIRLHKALCYEDIVLWVVRDPNRRGRDVLAMEVFLRHHKGAEKKPKPDPSADGLTKAFSHMSIRCNPEVPRDIPKAELAKLPPPPEVVELMREVKRTSLQLRQQYGFIKSAPKRIKAKYSQLRCDLRNSEKAFRCDMTKVYQEEYRRRMHNEELERQLNGMAIEEKIEPAVEHQLPERSRLQNILCDFRTDMSLEDITARKIRAIDMMVRLAACREVRQLRPGPSQEASRESSPEVAESKLVLKLKPFEKFPLLLGKTQCIYCVGDERLTHAARMRKFKRVSHMMDHVENVHLRHEHGNARASLRVALCHDSSNHTTEPEALRQELTVPIFRKMLEFLKRLVNTLMPILSRHGDGCVSVFVHKARIRFGLQQNSYNLLITII
ncbi:FluG domain-containing protein [Beauveria bassiana ARSEF 2860]|uniref:FluG domain-containing protein n=1 Tax=Beauveria bassiana (strain ARSEF 2860) TaxID=655819 RepID=J5J674_BEAB2|nr:FluG domain-containing protein [Beauveria bassiana ARSEF 2860]EJP62038.1 FluG domain-containing protein [Beauveria bassiana ARSEF 2860]